MATTGLFTCIELAIVFVGMLAYERTFKSRFSMNRFLKACLTTALLYVGIAGVWHHENEQKKQVFLNHEYLTLRDAFKNAGSHVTNGGKVDADGTLDQIVRQRKELILRQFPFVKGDIRWEVCYDKDTFDKGVYFQEENVTVPFGWTMPPFPWQLRAYFEYYPYSSER